MGCEILIERVGSTLRLAVMENKRLCEYYCERENAQSLSGNIYAGRVENVLPGMNAAFVDIGMKKNAFLHAADIHFDTRGMEELKSSLERRRIEKMVRPGQMIVAQVVKEPGGSKGPRISGSITLPGRLSVLLPTEKYVGVSKKIEDEAERDRLYEIAARLAQKHGAGVIIRTAGEGADESDIESDYERILSMWQGIESSARHAAVPALIQRDADLCLRAVRDMLDENVDAIRADDPECYAALKKYASQLTPAFAERISYAESETPLFDLYRVDHQLESAVERHVWLKSGGSLVIDETEAMTVIDVNTGKFVGKNSLEDTIYKINLEAAEEIARQLRLRDVGGIVIIDFIDMRDACRRDALVEEMRRQLKRDKNRTNVLGMTQLGLVEMTRKKLRKPLSKRLMRDCTHCLATGREWTYETVAFNAVREIWRKQRCGGNMAYVIETGEKVASWIATIGLPEGARARVETGHAEGQYAIRIDTDLK